MDDFNIVNTSTSSTSALPLYANPLCVPPLHTLPCMSAPFPNSFLEESSEANEDEDDTAAIERPERQRSPYVTKMSSHQLWLVCLLCCLSHGVGTWLFTGVSGFSLASSGIWLGLSSVLLVIFPFLLFRQFVTTPLGQLTNAFLSSTTEIPKGKVMKMTRELNTLYQRLSQPHVAWNQLRPFFPDVVAQQLPSTSQLPFPVVLPHGYTSQELTVVAIDFPRLRQGADVGVPEAIQASQAFAAHLVTSIVHEYGGLLVHVGAGSFVCIWNYRSTASCIPTRCHQTRACQASLSCVHHLRTVSAPVRPYVEVVRIAMVSSTFLVVIPEVDSGKSVQVFGAEMETLERLLPLNDLLEVNILVTGRVADAVKEEFVCQVVDRVRMNSSSRDNSDNKESEGEISPVSSLGLKPGGIPTMLIYELLGPVGQVTIDTTFSEAMELFLLGQPSRALEILGHRDRLTIHSSTQGLLEPLDVLSWSSRRHRRRLYDLLLSQTSASDEHSPSTPSEVLARQYLPWTNTYVPLLSVAPEIRRMYSQPSCTFSEIMREESVDEERLRKLMCIPATSPPQLQHTAFGQHPGSTSSLTSSFTATKATDLTEGPVMVEVQDTEGAQWHVSNTVVGKGSWGTVYMGMNDLGMLVAVKQIKVAETESAESVLREIRLLSQFRHDNIVGYLGSAYAHGYVIIILEWCPGGSLHSLLSTFTRLPVISVARYSHDILKGLAYLHRHHIIHRDIKPRNVLVTSSGQCKLADFGTSGKLGELCMVGTVIYMAPEAFKFEWCEASDIWSFGVTLFQMLTLDFPWDILGSGSSGVTAYQLQCSQWRVRPMNRPEIPTDVTDLILSCLKVNLNCRPTAAEIIKHPFIANSMVVVKQQGQGSICHGKRRSSRVSLQKGSVTPTDLMSVGTSSDDDQPRISFGSFLAPSPSLSPVPSLPRRPRPSFPIPSSAPLVTPPSGDEMGCSSMPSIPAISDLPRTLTEIIESEYNI